jgi:hypothetical protein
MVTEKINRQINRKMDRMVMDRMVRDKVLEMDRMVMDKVLEMEMGKAKGE